MIRRLRTPESIKKKIDSMLRKGEVVLDHGVGAYEFDHYEYEEGNYDNSYTSSLKIFYKDFNKEKTPRLYMIVTENDLRKPKKDDWYTEFVDCYWEKEFPTLLYMREYTIR